MFLLEFLCVFLGVLMVPIMLLLLLAKYIAILVLLVLLAVFAKAFYDSLPSPPSWLTKSLWFVLRPLVHLLTKLLSFVLRSLVLSLTNALSSFLPTSPFTDLEEVVAQEPAVLQSSVRGMERPVPAVAHSFGMSSVDTVTPRIATVHGGSSSCTTASDPNDPFSPRNLQLYQQQWLERLREERAYRQKRAEEYNLLVAVEVAQGEETGDACPELDTATPADSGSPAVQVVQLDALCASRPSSPVADRHVLPSSPKAVDMSLSAVSAEASSSFPDFDDSLSSAVVDEAPFIDEDVEMLPPEASFEPSEPQVFEYLSTLPAVGDSAAVVPSEVDHVEEPACYQDAAVLAFVPFVPVARSVCGNPRHRHHHLRQPPIPPSFLAPRRHPRHRTRHRSLSVDVEMLSPVSSPALSAVVVVSSAPSPDVEMLSPVFSPALSPVAVVSSAPSAASNNNNNNNNITTATATVPATMPFTFSFAPPTPFVFLLPPPVTTTTATVSSASFDFTFAPPAPPPLMPPISSSAAPVARDNIASSSFSPPAATTTSAPPPQTDAEELLEMLVVDISNTSKYDAQLLEILALEDSQEVLSQLFALVHQDSDLRGLYEGN